ETGAVLHSITAPTTGNGPVGSDRQAGAVIQAAPRVSGSVSIMRAAPQVEGSAGGRVRRSLERGLELLPDLVAPGTAPPVPPRAELADRSAPGDDAVQVV